MRNRYFSTPYGYSTALDDVTLLQKVPSIFASNHSIQRDENHYKLFKTADIISALRDEGYYPVYARTNGSRNGSAIDDTRKHLVRFTHRDFIETPLKVND